MDKVRKITSVVELAAYCTGTVLYRVALRPIGLAKIQIPPGEEWMNDVHPKILFDRGFASKSWKFRAQLPKLCAVDFTYVTELLTSEPVVERFEVVDIARSFDTGEFYYCNGDGDWMPESCLMTTANAARREKIRIKALFKKWADRTALDEE